MIMWLWDCAKKATSVLRTQVIDSIQPTVFRVHLLFSNVTWIYSQRADAWIMSSIEEDSFYRKACELSTAPTKDHNLYMPCWLFLTFPRRGWYVISKHTQTFKLPIFIVFVDLREIYFQIKMLPLLFAEISKRNFRHPLYPFYLCPQIYLSCNPFCWRHLSRSLVSYCRNLRSNYTMHGHFWRSIYLVARLARLALQ